MRPVADIVADARHAVDTGAKEIQLLGQIVNHYQAPDDPSCDFAGLLERLNDIDGLERIRFASPHPRHVTPRMIEALRTLPKVCRHLHLPVQSGSTDVLRAMRRRHTREEYLSSWRRLREAMPDIALSTDMIVGFPGETREDFEQTLSLTEAVRYHSMFSFKYSPRPNTLALKRMPRRCAGGGEDAADRGAAGAAGADPGGALTAADRTRRAGPGRFAKPPARVGAVGPDVGNTVVNFSGDPSWIGRRCRCGSPAANPNSLRGDAWYLKSLRRS